MVTYAHKRVFVTGGTGLVGGRLAERLAFEEQADVRVLVHDWRNAAWICRADVELVQGDVLDLDAMAQAMKGCEIVFHCVGIDGDWATCMSVNVEGTHRVLNAARRAQVRRIVYLSTVAVHGPKPPDQADETAAFCKTGTPYGDSKIAAEELVWKFMAANPVEVVTIRPTPVWGPRGVAFTLNPVRQMKAGRFCLIDEGHGIFQAVNVDNLVDALLLAGLKREAAGEAFIVADAEPYTCAQFYGCYARMLNLAKLPSCSSCAIGMAFRFSAVTDACLSRLPSPPRTEPGRFLVRALRYALRESRKWMGRQIPCSPWQLARSTNRGRLNTRKAHRRLGYAARLTLHQGMQDTEAWLRDQRYI